MVKSTSAWLFLFAREIHSTHYSSGIDSSTATRLSNSAGGPKGTSTLSVASIAGIAVGIVVVISALSFVLFILYRRRRSSNKPRDNTMPTNVATVSTSTIVPFVLQTSAAVHHCGGLYTPVTENLMASSSVYHDIPSFFLMFPFYAYRLIVSLLIAANLYQRRHG